MVQLCVVGLRTAVHGADLQQTTERLFGNISPRASVSLRVSWI